MNDQTFLIHHHPLPSQRSNVSDQTVMTARQLLSILRLSQALARLRFDDHVRRRWTTWGRGGLGQQACLLGIEVTEEFWIGVSLGITLSQRPRPLTLAPFYPNVNSFPTQYPR